MTNNKNQKGGGYYTAVGEGMIAGMPLYKGYHDMTPPLFKGGLLNTSLKDISCPYAVEWVDRGGILQMRCTENLNIKELLN